LESWRLLDSESAHDAAVNLAIEEAILQARAKKAVPPTVRFWRNDRAVVIGYSQSVEAEVDIESCRRGGVQVVRRLTGGGAVYHDLGNLNYTVVLDADHRLVRNLDIARSHRVLCSGLIKGLEGLGLTADFRPLSDIFIHGRKVSGSAQARRRGVILHHGTLLVDADLDMLTRVLAPIKGRMMDKSTSTWKPVTRLRDELGREVGMKNLKSALTQGFERAFGVRLTPGTLTSAEEEAARTLHHSRYSRTEWNLWR